MQVLKIGDVTIDWIRGELRIPGNDPVELSPMESEFLVYLARRHDQVISKDELLREVWRYNGVVSRAVDATLLRVRTKLAGTGVQIESRRGRGLVLCAEDLPDFGEETDTVPAPPPVIHAERPLGRDDVLARIDAQVQRGAPVILLVGPSGMGKTTVLSAWARAVRATSVDLIGIESAPALRRTVAAAFAVEAEDLDEGIRRRLAQTQPVVLDHADGLGPDANALLGRWIAGGAAPVLIGAQRPLRLPEQEIVVLSALREPDARALVRRVRERAGLGPITATDEDRLWTQLGGLPLALVMVAPLVQWIERPAEGLEVRTEGSGAHPTLLETIADTLHQLSPRALRVARTLAAFSAPPLATVLLDRLAGARPDTLAGLEELRLAGLATADDGRATLLPIVRTVLREGGPFRDGQREHDQGFVSWLLGLPPNHAVLGPLRRELEWALHLAEGAVRLRLLARHLLMLYAYGPADDLVPESDRWTTSLPVDLYADGQEIRAWARHAVRDHAGAEALLLPSLERIRDSSLKARGAAALATYRVRVNVPDAVAFAERAEALLEQVDEPFMRLDTLTLLGIVWLAVDEERGLATLERVIEEAGATYPVRGFLAATSRMRTRPASAWELDRARWLLGRASLAVAEGHRAAMNADLALCLLQAGEVDEAWERLQELRQHHREQPTTQADSLLMDAAVRCILVPERSLALLAEVNPRFSVDFASLIRRVAGDASVEVDPALAPFVDPLLTGGPLPTGKTPREFWLRARLELARPLAAAFRRPG